LLHSDEERFSAQPVRQSWMRLDIGFDVWRGLRLLWRKWVLHGALAWGIWPYAICAFLVSGACVVGVATAQAPADLAQASASAADKEPITAIPPAPAADPLKLALGEQLFGDRRLSHNGNLACLSCHDIRTNGTRDAPIDPSTHPFRTLSVFNAALSFRLNWEGNFRTLEAQTESSLENPANLATSASEVVEKLKADPEMNRRFANAYGRPPDRTSLPDAIAIYLRSLRTPGSRFDLWLGGDASALSTKDLEGYRLFKSFGCISCHQGVNVGGNLFERHGIFRPLAAAKPELVRVPSLRNVATRPPYFHDGSAPTLDDAVRKMSAAQLDRTLSDQQVEAIVAFLNSLTGTYRGAVVTGAAR
jgi:cytochrome c peroxidase